MQPVDVAADHARAADVGRGSPDDLEFGGHPSWAPALARMARARAATTSSTMIPSKPMVVPPASSKAASSRRAQSTSSSGRTERFVGQDDLGWVDTQLAGVAEGAGLGRLPAEACVVAEGQGDHVQGGHSGQPGRHGHPRTGRGHLVVGVGAHPTQVGDVVLGSEVTGGDRRAGVSPGHRPHPAPSRSPPSPADRRRPQRPGPVLPRVELGHHHRRRARRAGRWCRR